MAVREGGWGWVVVLCCFYQHMFAASAVYSLSVYYISWVEDFETGRGITSWVMTLSMAFSMGSGVGQGMQYLPSLALIPFYFQKKRSFAMGLAVCGSGVGTFLYPSFLIWLEEQFTWRGAMLIVSGLILNVAVCGALLRLLEAIEDDEDLGKELQQENEEVIQVKYEVADDSGSPLDGDKDKIILHPSKGNIDVEIQSLLGLHDTDNEEDEDSREKQKLMRLVKAPLFSNDTIASFSYVSQNGQLSSPHNQSNGHMPMQSSASRLSSGNVRLPIQLKSPIKQGLALQRLKHNAAPRSNSLQQLRMSQSEVSSQRHKFSSVFELWKGSNTDKSSAYLSTSASLVRKPSSNRSNIDFLLSNSIFDLDEAEKKRNNFLRQLLHQDNQDAHSSHAPSRYNSAWVLDIQVSETVPRQNPDDSSVKDNDSLAHLPTKPKICCFCLQLHSHFKIYLDLMKNPIFATFSLVNFLNSLTYLMPVVYIVDRAVDNGVDKGDAALAFSMYGAGNLIGRVAIGLLADRGLNSLLLGAACLMGCGVSTCLSPLCGANAILHGVYGFIFGTGSGGFVTLTPLILVDLLGLSMVSRSYGFTLMFQAMGYVAGTPVAG
ncbi:hypothetical protein EGW08_014959 [Elysia chlorotica]|uniref:Major facilitator superfamily (MFS) profile domain-containing protein n=1 Tax=Elysia chlorotica TaxID=188477 RepID=A0A3S1BCA5_ELYCH|nr:hypothetical protein EGW08_014959 [Elysia chlorotica]